MVVPDLNARSTFRIASNSRASSMAGNSAHARGGLDSPQTPCGIQTGAFHPDAPWVAY
jgi:hypothetical protein